MFNHSIPAKSPDNEIEANVVWASPRTLNSKICLCLLMKFGLTQDFKTNEIFADQMKSSQIKWNLANIIILCYYIWRHWVHSHSPFLPAPIPIPSVSCLPALPPHTLAMTPIDIKCLLLFAPLHSWQCSWKSLAVLFRLSLNISYFCNVLLAGTWKHVKRYLRW